MDNVCYRVTKMCADKHICIFVYTYVYIYIYIYIYIETDYNTLPASQPTSQPANQSASQPANQLASQPSPTQPNPAHRLPQPTCRPASRGGVFLIEGNQKKCWVSHGIAQRFVFTVICGAKSTARKHNKSAIKTHKKT